MPSPLNILLLQAEDTGRHLGCYGDAYAHTPNIDRLAAEGCRYTNAFSHSPVCAPSRGGTVTGCYPWAVGIHHMRSKRLEPPRCFTHELVDGGHHVSWPTKLDFNFDPTPGWCTDNDEWWEKPPPDAPFFLYANFDTTHESSMFRELPDWHRHSPEDCPAELRHDPDQAPVPPYLPDTPELRWQLSRYYDALTVIDRQIGERLAWLERHGLAENTVVIFLSDHGRGLPREKRWCYEAGIHLPLIVRWPGRLKPGSVSDEMVGWVDIAPTILSLAGRPVPPHYQGQVFLGENRAAAREYIFAGRDRMDSLFDKVRVTRDRRHLYIRNDAAPLPWAQKQSYMEQLPAVPVMREMHARGELSGPSASFFGTRKPNEELYDCEADPDNLVNLAGDPAHTDTLERLRAALDTNLVRFGDLGEVDERSLIERGVIADSLTDYAERDDPRLPPEQQIGPMPPPMTLEEFRKIENGFERPPKAG